MAKWRVLVSAPYMMAEIERFRAALAAADVEIVVPPVNERLEEHELLGLVGEIDGAICGDDRYTRAVIEAAVPRLKVISKWGTGIDSIDQAACAELGVQIRRTPNAFSEPVADSVFAYMLSFARRTPWMDRAMKAGKWHKINGFALNEATLGVIGVGDCGKAVLRRGPAFGLRLLGNDIKPVPQAFIDEVGLVVVDKQTLLHEADIVTMHTDLNPTSYHLMGAAEFAMMKPTAYFINTSRGPVHDELALIEALQRGEIAGAALDVFEDEPLPADSPLKQMDNVLLAPHNANSSHKAWEAVHENTIRNLLMVLRGEE